MVPKTRRRFAVMALPILCLGAAFQTVCATELVKLSPENWESFVPRGKEVDAIFGDFVLRNEKLTLVIGNPVSGRNGNMTLKNVGGVVIDLTLRGEPNDQLGAFYPAPNHYPVPDGRALKLVRIAADGIVHYDVADKDGSTSPTSSIKNAEEILLVFTMAKLQAGQPDIQVEYRLANSDESLSVTTIYGNSHEQPLELVLADLLRVDGEFSLGFEENGSCWAYDIWWQQAYGIFAEKALLSLDPKSLQSKGYLRMFGPMLRYESNELASDTLMPGESFTLVRRIFPARDSIAVKAIAARLAGKMLEHLSFRVFDSAGPIEQAHVEIIKSATKNSEDSDRGVDENIYGSGRTSSDGILHVELPAGSYQLRVTSPGRDSHMTSILVPGDKEVSIEMPVPGYVFARICDETGDEIPCKVGFYGLDSTPDPCFGPDSGINGVRNLYYTHTGKFRLEIAPGRYQVVVSHGPEYDAVVKLLDVRSGEETKLVAALVRTVDTTGWISADLHSHSSPSGDTTASQRGRVLNNLAEHLEFCPSTEHNRVSSVAQHLEFFGATDRMLTCPGIELTGHPLGVNHQNAFPLRHRPNTQNGGGPEPDVSPVAQIERLAQWDDGAEKLVQLNHPNIVQILADRDLDGKHDGGFVKMFDFADVVEVHPLEDIFHWPEALPANSRERSNTIFHWLQALNLGYRLPGVVNTDGHSNFHKLYDLGLLDGVTCSEFDWTLHGAGALRNYIGSSTDNPGKANLLELCRAAKRGTLVMTNGPFLEVQATAPSALDGLKAELGHDLHAPEGAVSLRVRVQCPNWIRVNRVQLFLNGRASENWNLTRRTHSQYFHDGSVVFDGTLELSLKEDTHIIVAAAGEGEELGIVMGPDAGKMMPMAVTNPIFVDTDGNGFRPNGDMLGLPLLEADGGELNHLIRSFSD